MPKYPAVPGLTGSTLKQKQRIVGLLKKVCVDVRTSNVIISRYCLAQNELKYLLYVFFFVIPPIKVTVIIINSLMASA